MNKFMKLAAAAAVAITASTSSFAADHTLTISSWTGPGHGINAIMWPNLIKMIEEATDGRVTAEVKLGLAPPPAQMDLVMDGAADMTIIFHGYQPGRFTATKLIELPGYDGNAEAASVAYWRVFEKYLAAADEHRGVKVMGLSTHGPGQVHSNKEVTTLEQLANLKTRLPGGVANEAGRELGMIGIQVPAPKVYETLASDAADAVMMPYEGRVGFNLTEVAKNVYEMPGGFYRGSFAFLMSQETFDSLPADIQAALEEKVFGEPASRMLGAAWDEIDNVGREATVAAGDNKIVEANEQDQRLYGLIANEIRKTVLAEISGLGIDAQAAYDMVKAEMAAQ